MKWSYGITTVSERFTTTLPKTLQSLAAAGFPEPHLFVDGVCLPNNEIQDQYWISSRVPRIGLSANWHLSIVELYLREPVADRFALFQDDLVAVRNLRSYLESCDYPDKGYLNLFTFLDNESKASQSCPTGWVEGAELANSRGQVYHGKRQQRGIGALALVFSREALTTLLMQPHFITRPQSGEAAKTKIDGGIVESMNQAGWREYIHNPSLIAHRGTSSTKPGVRWSSNARSFPGEAFNAMDFTTPALQRYVTPQSRKLRVGLLTPTLLFGGAERWVAAIASGLDRSSIQVTGVGNLNRDMVFPAIGEKIRNCCPILEGVAGIKHLASRSDILVIWGLTNLSILKGFSGHTVMTSHGHCGWTTNIIRRNLPYITDWASVSRHAANSFPDPSRVAIVHNGIDVDRCTLIQTREEVRKSWGLQPSEIAIGYVGRLSAEKNPLEIVKAARELGPRYRAVLVGGGTNTDKFVHDAKQISSNVIHQPPVENVGDIYRALDCFILVSPSEGFSLALAEAWYCKCPTVATPVGATELEEMYGQLSIHVPVGASPATIAEAVRQATLPTNHAVIERAAKVVADEYTAESMCQRWAQYLLSLPGV